MTLDGYATFLLQIHVVQHLTLGYLDGIGMLQQPVGQGRLAMVYVCYYAKVPYILHSVFSLLHGHRASRVNRLTDTGSA